MRLANLVPPIPEDTVDQLEAIEIRTEIDLLFSMTSAEIIKKLPEGALSITDLEGLKKTVIRLCSDQGKSASEMLSLAQDQQADSVELSTGCEAFDRLLHGLCGGTLIQVSGDRYSGKTLVCLNIVLRNLDVNRNAQALWIDTSGGFSVDTALEILHSGKMQPTILDRLQVTVAFDIDAAQGLLDEIEHSCPQVVVVDSITALFAPLLSAASAQGHAIMSEFMIQLRSFAQTQYASVLIINNTARQGPDTTERKPALGPSFGLLTDSTLWLQKSSPESNNPCFAKLISSKSKLTDQMAQIQFQNANVVAI